MPKLPNTIIEVIDDVEDYINTSIADEFEEETL